MHDDLALTRLHIAEPMANETQARAPKRSAIIEAARAKDDAAYK